MHFSPPLEMFFNRKLRNKLKYNSCVPNTYRVLLRLIPIVFTDKMPKKFAGYFQCYWIKIRPRYKSDIGLLIHELTHFKQFLKLPIAYCYYRMVSAEYRYKCELEAYAVQTRYYLCTTFKQLKINGILSMSSQLTPVLITQIPQLASRFNYLVDTFANFIAADRLNKYNLPMKQKYRYSNVAEDLKRKVYELID